MSEYIEKRVAINVIKELQFSQHCRNFAKSDNAIWERFDTYNDAIAQLKLIVPADVAEVTHGAWNDGGRDGPHQYVVCSECGYGCGNFRWGYCPVCGSKMVDGRKPTEAMLDMADDVIMGDE